MCDDQHRGSFDALEAFCLAHGLTFVLQSEAGDGADAEVRWWAPDLPAVRSEAALDSTPALTVPTLRQLIDADSADEALARLRRRLEEATPPSVPALVITETHAMQDL